MRKFSPPFLFLIFMLSFSSAPLHAQHTGEYTNPILAGFYPDPSICRVDSDYYLVNSTFAYFPGITVFHSKDLVNWEHLGDVLNRPGQLDLDSAGVSRGIFAPAIRYHKGTFYVTCTLVDKGGNFVATAKNPAGPWSDPVWLPQVNGIDPSLFFDNSGKPGEKDKAYLIYNSIPPDNKPLYDGHRTIRMYEFDYKNLKVTGKEYLLVNGGTDISKKPVWIEGPHIFKISGYYYLICAQGGTSYNHSEVVFRSKKVVGPYIPYKNNPILTQRNLNPERPFPITCTGHADFVQSLSGKWWAVFLGCRPYPPYKEDYYNTGRETFMAPVKWVHDSDTGAPGWPVITSDDQVVKYYYHYPNPVIKTADDVPYSGNFTIMYNFNKDKLSRDWAFLRTPRERWYSLEKKKGFLAVQLRPETCSGLMNPSFLGRRQQHLKGEVSTALDFIPQSANEKAGLLIFQNETHFYYICKSVDNKEPVIQLYKSIGDVKTGKQMELLASARIPKNEKNNEVYLKITANGNKYSFQYGAKPGKWNVLKDSVDATYLSTKVAGGFVGCMYAIYATALGDNSGNTAYYDWFKYVGDDRVYK